MLLPAWAMTAIVLTTDARPRVSAALAARAAVTATDSVPIPTSMPAATSVGWCMPRYIRERATSSGIATATSQTGGACARRCGSAT